MLVKLIINAISLYVIAYLIPGVEIKGWETLLVLSIVWGIMAAVLKPILVILTLPINIVTLGLFTFVINALLLMLSAKIVRGFEIKSFSVALLAAVVLAVVNMSLSKIK